MKLQSTRLSRREMARRCGSSSQFFGVQLSTFGDGAQRGVRQLEFRTGSGFRFTVLVDRAFDIGAAEFCGAAIGWQSPTGFRHPGLHENADERGLGWLRSFSGLLVTGGLDHTLFMATDAADQYCYPPRSSQDYPLHGRISNTPGRLMGYGERWDGDDCTLWCEGHMVQAAVFGENLHLHRRIEAKAGESSLTITDRVVNRGFQPTPHMFLYHINLGYPVLDAGSQYLAPIRETVWASHADRLSAQQVGYITQPEPRVDFQEQVFEHSLTADREGRVPVALVNRAFRDGHGIGFAVEVSQDQFPCHFQWQNLQEGLYAMGLEPSTNHAQGRTRARERGELRWLGHDEERRYDTTMTVLEDCAQIDRYQRRIEAIHPLKTEEIPVIGGDRPSS